MKQKILLFLSSILSQITIILGVSTVMLFLNKNTSIILDYIVLGVTIVLLILDGILNVKQGTIIEPVVINPPSEEKKSSKETKAELLQEKFFDDIMEYCKSVGLNPSVSTESGTAMIVNIKGNEMQELLPLSLPEGKALTEKNYNEYLQFMKERIDTEKLKLK